LHRVLLPSDLVPPASPQVGTPCWNGGDFRGLATSNANVTKCWAGSDGQTQGGAWLYNHNWVEFWDDAVVRERKRERAGGQARTFKRPRTALKQLTPVNAPLNELLSSNELQAVPRKCSKYFSTSTLTSLRIIGSRLLLHRCTALAPLSQGDWAFVNVPPQSSAPNSGLPGCDPFDLDHGCGCAPFSGEAFPCNGRIAAFVAVPLNT